jgi:DNA polymerase-3 subunit epsilon
LAAVYLALTRGQESLSIGLETRDAQSGQAAARVRPKPLLLQASAEECAAHAEVIAAVDRESRGACLWSALNAPREAV